MKNLIRQTNWLWAATIITAAYFIGLGWLIGPYRVDTFFIEGDLNEVGDFLAGAFSPLAFIWLVAAVLTQRQELDETRDQFAKNQEVVDSQMKTINAQNELLQQQYKQSEESAKRTYRLSLFGERYKIYEQLMSFNDRHYRTNYTDEAYEEMVRIHQRASFVFGEDVENWIGEIKTEIFNNEQNRYVYSRQIDDGHGGLITQYTDTGAEETIENSQKWIWEQLLASEIKDRIYEAMRISDE